MTIYFIPLAILFALLSYLVLKKTTFGFSIRAIGSNVTASKAIGISVTRTILIVAIISAGLAGWAGTGEILGIQHRMRLDISPGYGWSGIVIALAAGLNPLGVIITAFFFAGLLNGMSSMASTTGIPVAANDIMQGLVLILILAIKFFVDYKIIKVKT